MINVGIEFEMEVRALERAPDNWNILILAIKGLHVCPVEIGLGSDALVMLKGLAQRMSCACVGIFANDVEKEFFEKKGWYVDCKHEETGKWLILSERIPLIKPLKKVW